MMTVLSAEEAVCYKQCLYTISSTNDEVRCLTALTSQWFTPGVAQRLLETLVDHTANHICLSHLLGHYFITSAGLAQAFAVNKQVFLVQHRLFPVQLIEAILQQPDQYDAKLVAAALASPCCGRELLTKLEAIVYQERELNNSCFSHMTEAVLQNPNCSQEILCRPEYRNHFLLDILKNPNCPSELLFNAVNLQERIAALRNPNCPLAIIQKIILRHHANRTLLEAALKHPNCDELTLRQNYKQHEHLVTANPNCPPDLLMQAMLVKASSFKQCCAQINVLLHPHATEKMLVIGMLTAKELGRCYAMLHPKAPHYLRRLRELPYQE